VHSIEQASESGLFGHIAVSSDSPEILQLAKQAGASLLIDRPSDLANDSAPKVPTIRHCFQSSEILSHTTFDTIVDLDATSPLRISEDIRACVDLLESDTSISNVITGTVARRSPYFNLVEEDQNKGVSLSKKLATPIVRRQDAPRCFDMNASIYVWRREALLTHDSLFLNGTRLYVMPEERSIDIDSELDFQIVEMIMAKASVGAQ
jgi:N-acylneuraminate cytidylyltransferase/CMP-N,N'-diacetyllegionaminic acid synthase